VLLYPGSVGRVAYTLEHDPVDGGLLVVATGELDVAATPELSTVLTVAGAGTEPAVILDLSEVDFVDSTALGVILRARESLEQEGRRLVMVATEGPVRRLLAITNMTQHFAPVTTRDEALALIAPRPT